MPSLHSRDAGSLDSQSGNTEASDHGSHASPGLVLGLTLGAVALVIVLLVSYVTISRRRAAMRHARAEAERRGTSYEARKLEGDAASLYCDSHSSGETIGRQDSKWELASPVSPRKQSLGPYKPPPPPQRCSVKSYHPDVAPPNYSKPVPGLPKVAEVSES